MRYVSRYRLELEEFTFVQAVGEGTHLLVPWLQRAILYDCRIKPRVRQPFLLVSHLVDDCS